MCAGCSRCPFLRHRTHAHAHGHAQLKMQPSNFQARKTSHLYAWSRDCRTAPCATMTWAACTVTSQKKQQTAASLELPTDALKQLHPSLQIVSDGPMSFSTSPAHLCVLWSPTICRTKTSPGKARCCASSWRPLHQERKYFSCLS